MTIQDSKKQRGTMFFMSKILPVLFCLGLVILPSACATISATATGWDQVPRILRNIKAPQFPDRDFKITDYGAVGDGKTDYTEAFRKAIAAANQAGGGRIVY